EQAGIHFSLGVPVDGEKLSALLEEHDLLFLGLGAQKSCTIELPGQNLRGVSQALDWLTTVNVGVEESLSGLNVVVVGGGDSAMDCARAALRLGAKVTIAYRGAETGLRASPKEVALAREEGVQFLFEYRPQQIQGSGAVSAVDFDTASGVSTVEADRVILALGQRPNPPVWLADFGIETDLEGCIQVDQQGGTSHPKIWAGGDNTHGPDLAVTAMAAGRRAAEGMLTVSQKMRRRG
ncbi:MAG: FAD-dependent oxidoreductase, partial [Gammaproteobacteria bacterium]|nr:FAD-dependent oxidoreductase [Gammaproteobacteria bacterium]